METTKREYIEQKHSKLLAQLNCFFAFNEKQFEDGLQTTGGIEKTGEYTHIHGGLFCPVKNIKKLREGMKTIEKQWYKDRKTNEKHQLIFVGIDSWNRPVWKAPDKEAYFGSVNILFSMGETEKQIRKQIKGVYDLCYFGNHFDCEPMGTDIPDKYYL
jgi:hypothetical protein